jgi:hypothetical protein
MVKVDLTNTSVRRGLAAEVPVSTPVLLLVLAAALLIAGALIFRNLG